MRVVAKGGAVQIIGQFTQKALTFLFVAVAVRLLGTSDYGLYREVFQVMTVATTLAAGGFPYAAVRFIARARAIGDHAGARGVARITLAGALVSSFVVIAILAIGAEPIARAFSDHRGDVDYLTFLLRVGVVFVPLYAGMQVLRFSTQAYKTMTPAVIVGNIVQPAARFIFSMAAIVAGFGVSGAVAGLVLSAGVAMAAGLYLFDRLLTAEERAARPRAELGPILRFVFAQAGVALFSTQSLGLGIIIVGLFATDRAVGLYAIAQSLQLAGGLFLGSISGIWAPVVVDLFERGDKERLGSLYQTINRWIATFSVPIFAALMVQPELFARILGGGDGASAAVLIPILAAGNLFYVGTGPSSILISMTGRPGINSLNSVVSVGLYVGLGILVVPSHGVVGMAVVDASVTALLNVARVVEGKILVGVQPFGRTFFKPVLATVAAVVVALAVRLTLGHTTVPALISLGIAGLVYLVVLRLQGIEPEERHVIDRVKGRLPGPLRRV